MEEELELTTAEDIQNLIYTVRGKQVMLDSDVANLYHYETKKINQAVKRNIERFPEGFCFQLTESELENLRSQFVTLKIHILLLLIENKNLLEIVQYSFLQLDLSFLFQYYIVLQHLNLTLPVFLL